MSASKLLGSAALVFGCSTLPEYAAPKGQVMDPSELASSDLIGYRAITRDDFRGTRVPEAFAAVADRVGAATCATISTTPGTKLRVTGTQFPDGSAKFKATALELGFQARMDRSCSWWNEKVASRLPEYTLQHEQIHFAIFELEARRLNAEVPAISRKLRLEGKSAEEVQKLAQEVMNEELTEALERVLERSRDFDADTSLGYKPEQQKRWLDRVSSELVETSR